MSAWQSVFRPEVQRVLNNGWFRKLGLFFLADYSLTPTS